MKNGLNISGVSEFVNELKECPEEAPVVFHVEANHQPYGEGISIKTIQLGTKRATRAFHLPLSIQAHNPFISGPREYLLIALGSCVMVTYTQGCSAKGITITRFSLRVEAEEDKQNHTLKNIRYTVSIDAEGSKEDLAMIAAQVSCFSPNHRTFVEENEIEYTFSIQGTDEKQDIETPRSQLSFEEEADTIALNLEWDYGTQLKGTILSKPFSKDNTFKADQPKQVVGIDLAPNPQEYLFAALAGDVLQGLTTRLHAKNVMPTGLNVRVNGNLDFRGLLNMDPKVPVKVHNLVLNVETEGYAGDEATLRNELDETMQESLVANIIRTPQEVQVECKLLDKQVTSFSSNKAQVYDFLEQVAKAAQEQQKQTEAINS